MAKKVSIIQIIAGIHLPFKKEEKKRKKKRQRQRKKRKEKTVRNLKLNINKWTILVHRKQEKLLWKQILSSDYIKLESIKAKYD